MMEFQGIPFSSITLRDGFWKKRYNLNRKVSIPAVRDRFEETGRFDALRFHYKEGDPLHVYYDSDVAKWMEGVCYLYRTDKRGMAKNMALVEEMITSMEKNQREDGYLNSFFQQKEPTKIFTDRAAHELYCAGHLCEAAVAYTEATGNRRFLQVMEKYLACIRRAFIEEKTAKFITPGHQELELALVRMYRLTGNRDYLDMAGFFLRERGSDAEKGNESTQSHLPLAKMTDMIGHAVRGIYYLTGAVTYATEAKDSHMLEICKRLFDSMEGKAYITGGYGSSRVCECFVSKYVMPNREAYSESCASIAMLYLTNALLEADPHARYAETAERAMYNCLLSSTSQSGDAFFYENPLEIDLRARRVNEALRPPFAITRRQKVFSCSCCPPNINRFFSSFANLLFTKSKDTLFVNQYVACDARDDLGALTVKTRYPVGKTVEITGRDFALPRIALRIPAFAKKYQVMLNGKEVTGQAERGYMVFDVPKSFVLTLKLSFAPVFYEAHPSVRDDCGRVALCYGPVVYCLEGVDNGEDLNALSVDMRRRIHIAPHPETGLFTLTATGYRDLPFDGLYQEARGKRETVALRFIPYFYFANREETDMLVWVRKK